MTLRALRIRGTFRGPTGHDRHVRSFTRELVAAGVDVQLVDMPEWSARRLPERERDPWFETLTRNVEAQLYLQFCMPHQVRPASGLVPVNFTMFEADRVPGFWVSAAQKTLITIVPEESSRQSWIAAGADPERLRTCPLGIDPAVFGVASAPLPIALATGEDVSDRRVRFLNLAEIVPRKNQRGLLRAWLEATTADDDAVLVMKLGGVSPEDYEGVRGYMPELEEVSGKSFRNAAPVVQMTDVLTDNEMPRLYAAATHYISMSFGEGWDLPLMEAAASGLALIAPDHTAYKSYLNASIATMLPVREVAASTEDGFHVYFTGASWWEPQREAAVAAIRDAIDGREKTVASARDYILGHYTWRHATKRLIEVLEEAELLGVSQLPALRSSR